MFLEGLSPQFLIAKLECSATLTLVFYNFDFSISILLPKYLIQTYVTKISKFDSDYLKQTAQNISTKCIFSLNEKSTILIVLYDLQ